jgi:hypothetical protein
VRRPGDEPGGGQSTRASAFHDFQSTLDGVHQLRTAMRYKIEVQDDTGIWTDVRGPDGTVLVYTDEGAARAALAEKYPVLVQMEKYAGGKRTRVIRILEDEDD